VNPLLVLPLLVLLLPQCPLLTTCRCLCQHGCLCLQVWVA
jgi:hypothetical protein